MSSNDSNDNDVVRFRPHHFMCTLSFRGRGYSLDFIKNYKKIVEKLNHNENTIIEVAEYMDDICAPCPNRLNDTLCKVQEKISQLDQRHAEILEIKPGDRISWKQAKMLIRQKMNLDQFHYACSGCSWKVYGVCEANLKELHNS